MNIFKNRPLCMILCMMLGGFALFSRLDRSVAMLCFLTCAVTALLVFLLARRRAPRLTVALVCLCLSFLLSHLYFDLWFQADRRVEGDTAITGSVVDISYAKNYGAAFLVETDTIGDLPFSHYRLLLIADCNASDLALGDRIRFHGEILRLDGAEELSDYENSSFALGCNGGLLLHAYQTISDGEGHPLRAIDRLRTRIGRYIDRTAGESAPLLRALFLGDTSAMSSAEIQDFRRIGISHLLAVSGMHLSILSAFLNRLFRRLRLRVGLRSALLMLFTLGYMTLTGFSPSVLRAGIMLLLFLTLSTFPGSSDSLTDLSLAFFLICLIKPYAVFDLSLLLSAFATLGILAAPRLTPPPKKRPLRHLLFALLSPILISFFAAGATLPFTVLLFGEISLLSLVSTPIFGILIEAFMILGIPTLLLGGLLPLSVPLSALSHLIALLASFFSDLHGVFFSADFPLCRILTFLFAVGFFLFLSLPIKHKKTAVGMLFLLFLSVFLSSALLTANDLSTAHAYYFEEETGEALLLTANGRVTLVASADHDAYALSASLKKKRITEVEDLVLTDYASDLPQRLKRLAAHTKLRRVLLPLPQSNDERFLLSRVEDALSDTAVTVDIITVEGERPLATADLTLKYRNETGDVSVLLLQSEGASIAYLSCGALLCDTEKTETVLSEAEYIIFGKYGMAYDAPQCAEAQMPRARAVLLASEDLTLSEQERAALLSRGGFLYTVPTHIKLY